jgi:hypothetical protein
MHAHYKETPSLAIHSLQRIKYVLHFFCIDTYISVAGHIRGPLYRLQLI